MKRVLVVEDSTPIRMLLATVLADEGYSVDTACDGESALERASETAYDLVVTDMTLPGISGSEVIRGLRALEQHRSTPVLVVTAVTRADKLRASRDAGAGAFIFKPFKSENVVQTVRSLLSGREGYVAAAHVSE
jgi:DNA-binding response OmpR family regulator